MHPTSSASSVSPSSPDLPPICSRSADLPPQELLLLDLLGAPPGSFLESLGAVLSRVDSLAHVLAWARYDEGRDLSQPAAVKQSELAIVTLPRLKLTFQARRVGGVVRLFSADHADLFITNERDELTSGLLAGMPHSLLLSNSNGEVSVLVAADAPVRPIIEQTPFSTALVIDRHNAAWASALEHPYYVYPVRAQPSRWWTSLHLRPISPPALP